jgi:hypothetical protein
MAGRSRSIFVAKLSLWVICFWLWLRLVLGFLWLGMLLWIFLLAMDFGQIRMLLAWLVTSFSLRTRPGLLYRPTWRSPPSLGSGILFWLPRLGQESLCSSYDLRSSFAR